MFSCLVGASTLLSYALLGLWEDALIRGAATAIAILAVMAAGDAAVRLISASLYRRLVDEPGTSVVQTERVYDSLEIEAQNHSAGEDIGSYDTVGAPSGLHVYRLQGGGFVEPRHMVMMKY